MTEQSYRVAHYGTGDTGSQALRCVIARPEFELVAHLVHSPDKVGRDSGEIVGVGPVGVRATDSLDEFLAIDADCVAYFATDFGREPEARGRRDVPDARVGSQPRDLDDACTGLPAGGAARRAAASRRGMHGGRSVVLLQRHRARVHG